MFYRDFFKIVTDKIVTDRQTNKQTDRQTDRQIDRQHKYIYMIYLYLFSIEFVSPNMAVEYNTFKITGSPRYM